MGLQNQVTYSCQQLKFQYFIKIHDYFIWEICEQG